DAARAVRVLNQMTAKDAEQLDIAEHDRGAYFRVDRAKGNNAPPEKAVWRRFTSVELTNTDDVGVVVAWEYPQQGSPQMAEAERAADQVFMVILVRFTTQGRLVSDRPGPNYAPAVFAQEPEAKAAKLGKRVLTDAMRRLFAARRLRVEER